MHLMSCSPLDRGCFSHRIVLTSLVSCLALAALSVPSRAQQPTSDAPQYRQLAEGVEKVLDPERDFFELTSQHDVAELATEYDWAKDVVFRHDIWAFEFAFKPVRMIKVKVPGPDGEPREKLIWYMVYRVRNPGTIYRAEPTVYEARDLTEQEEEFLPVEEGDPAKKDTVAGRVVSLSEEEFIQELKQKYADENGMSPEEVDLEETPLKLQLPRFVPTFALYSIDTGGKTYLDRIIPSAMKPIQDREDANRPLKNTVEIAGRLPVSEAEGDQGVWGVVTWQDVDPRTDYFSIFIQGLSNAYRWEDTPNGRWFARKTLRLDFWRPGDEVDEDESEIRFLRHSWVFLDSSWSSRPPSGN
ncbi:Hypothetical protein PBC10988_20150 [Planctomycetales bacterium 10988]|nr:Hypothetical protein PBC10988_20150 [Planctomycetales bacterium 10988]